MVADSGDESTGKTVALVATTIIALGSLAINFLQYRAGRKDVE